MFIVKLKKQAEHYLFFANKAIKRIGNTLIVQQLSRGTEYIWLYTTNDLTTTAIGVDLEAIESIKLTDEYNQTMYKKQIKALDDLKKELVRG